MMRPERIDESTGEILPAVGTAGDGFKVPMETRSAGNLIDQLEDGRFSAEVYHEAKQLGQFLGDRARMTERDAKGKLVIEIEMVAEAGGETFKMQPKFTVKKPVVARQRSTAWQDDAGNFTRFPPNQMQMFDVRNVADEQRGPVRSI